MKKLLPFHLGLVYFIGLGLVFSVTLDYHIRGPGDAAVAIVMFENSFLSFMNISLHDEVQSRIVILIASLAEVLLLISVKLIKKEVAITYFIWPFAAFLATKIKFEFFVFPLALIRTDLPRKFEFILLLLLSLLYVYSGEGNLAIIIIFRLALLVYQNVNALRAKVLFIVALFGAIAIDKAFSVLATYSPMIARFEWTRDYVNPEYSLVETLGVFFATFFLGVQPQIDYVITLVATAILLSFLFLYHRKKLVSLLSDKRFYAFVTTLILLTSLTHAFQSARYYFIFLPLLAPFLVTKSRDILFFLIMSVGTSIAVIVFHNGGKIL